MLLLMLVLWRKGRCAADLHRNAKLLLLLLLLRRLRRTRLKTTLCSSGGRARAKQQRESYPSLVVQNTRRRSLLRATGRRSGSGSCDFCRSRSHCGRGLHLNTTAADPRLGLYDRISSCDFILELRFRFG
jgi:hypothetical protein